MSRKSLTISFLIFTIFTIGLSGNGQNAYAVETWTLGDVTSDAAGTTNMNDVSMFDANTGIAVGQLGVIVFTSDGGVTWTLGDVASDAAATNELLGVSMTSANDAVAVGQQGTVVHTSDGGVTWTLGDTGDAAGTNNLQGVSMTSNTQGIAVGNGGTIIHTNDGGVTWTLGDTGDAAGTTNIFAVSMTSALDAVAVGNSGTVVHTSDGGVTWTVGDTGDAAGSGQLIGVSMFDAEIGVVVGGGGVIVRTDDGGVTFTLGDTGDAAGTNVVFEVSMTSATEGVAVGSLGLIIFTSDGGVTWTVGDTGDVASINQLQGVSMTSATEGVAVGVLGTIVFASATVATTTTTEQQGGGSGCSGDCENPTLGMTDHGRRLVDNGFSYNDNPIDVEHYFTPYPLVTAKVGVPNVAEFKIYDNSGPDKIHHFEFAFGLGKGESIDQNQAMIIWDKTFDGIETIELDDSQNVLENVRIFTSEVLCQEDSQQMCLLVEVYHTFRAPLEFNVLGTNVWDAKRNAMQNYYNHGVEVEGDSMNAPLTKEIPGSYKSEGLITITQTELYSNLWVATDGRIFEIWENGSYRLVNSVVKITDDTGDMRERDHSAFQGWKNRQAELATEIFDSTTLVSTVSESFAYEFPDVDSRTQFLIENGLIEYIRK